MKNYYFDTSALVKLYHEESGTDEVENIFSSEDSTIIISELMLILIMLVIIGLVFILMILK